MPTPLTVAYFTMEIGLKSSIPTFAGGLGVLAADIMRSCADLKVNAACMTVGWQYGYLRQKLHDDGTQEYADMTWDPAKELMQLPQQVSVNIEGHDVQIGVRVLELKSEGHTVPVYFLDTNLEENRPEDR